MNLPDAFVRTVITTFSDGRAWLDGLPTLLDQYAARWDLTLGEPFGLSYNYVCAAACADGAMAVFKAGVPNPEGRSEIAALLLWDGNGAVRVRQADPARNVFLMERLLPGTPIRALFPDRDDEATRIAAGAMRRLWRPAEPAPPLHRLADWTAGLHDLRRFFGGGCGPFPAPLVEAAEGLFADLPTGESVLLHGDLHHDNLLADGDGWRAIDPKGLVGDPGYEVGAWLRNFWGAPLDNSLLARRVDLFADELGFEKARVLGWGVAGTLLSAWWSYDEAAAEGGDDWRFAVEVASALETMRRRKR